MQMASAPYDLPQRLHEHVETSSTPACPAADGHAPAGRQPGRDGINDRASYSQSQHAAGADTPTASSTLGDQETLYYYASQGTASTPAAGVSRVRSSPVAAAAGATRAPQPDHPNRFIAIRHVLPLLQAYDAQLAARKTDSSRAQASPNRNCSAGVEPRMCSVSPYGALPDSPYAPDDGPEFLAGLPRFTSVPNRAAPLLPTAAGGAPTPPRGSKPAGAAAGSHSRPHSSRAGSGPQAAHAAIDAHLVNDDSDVMYPSVNPIRKHHPEATFGQAEARPKQRQDER